MWQKLPENIIQERREVLDKKPLIPRWVQSLLGTVIFLGFLYGISYLDDILGWRAVSEKQTPGFNLHNASALTLMLVFIGTILFMYFLLVKNRKPPVIFICFDCQEPFHAQTLCPACNSTNTSDIRLAQWHEEGDHSASRE